MNYLLHCHRTPGHIVPVPEGLTELMADISREVLRHQPSDLLTFIADYLDAMLLTRENTIIAETTVDDIMGYAMDVATFYTTTSMPESRAKHVVEMFQKYFKEEEMRGEGCEFDERSLMIKLIEECRLNKDEARKATKIIRDAYKKFYYRKVNYEPKLGEGAEWNEKVKNTLQIYAKAKPTQEEMNRAAICLQSAYRSYCVRKCMEKKRTKAATTIQAAFRGYVTRKRHVSTSSTSIDDDISTTKEDKNFTKIKEEDAATIIQSAFRGYETRKELFEFESDDHETIKVTDYTDTMTEFSETEAAQVIQNVYRGHKERTRWEEIASVVSSQLSDDASSVKQEITDAAVAIQSIYRGHKTRNAVSRYSYAPTDPSTAIQRPSKSSGAKQSKVSLRNVSSTANQSDLGDLVIISPVKLTPRTSNVSLKHSRLSIISNKSNTSTGSRK